MRFACLTKSGEGIGQNEVSYWLTPHQQLHTLDDNGFWKRLLWCDKHDYPMTAACKGKGVRSVGLIDYHAYSLIACKEVDGKRLVLLRNPWGNGKEWNGAWSDGSKEWKEHPQIAKALDYAPAEDGLFWMEWSDFHTAFDTVDVCPKDMRVAGEKTKKGLRQYPPSWHGRRDPKEGKNHEKYAFNILMMIVGGLCVAYQLANRDDPYPDP